jgi:hypothetical protein
MSFSLIQLMSALEGAWLVVRGDPQSIFTFEDDLTINNGIIALKLSILVIDTSPSLQTQPKNYVRLPNLVKKWIFGRGLICLLFHQFVKVLGSRG